jgi:hypothetical protein
VERALELRAFGSIVATFATSPAVGGRFELRPIVLTD